MSLENTKYWNHIVRYFSDSLSKVEEQELFKWLDLHPNYKEDFNQIKIIWESSKIRQKESQFDVEEIWKSLKPKLQHQLNKESDIKMGLKFNTRWIKIAAIFIVLIGIGFLLKNGFVGSDMRMVEIITPADSTMSFYLPDSTYIVLNENSIFTYPETFSENGREVTLSGEAYFDVKPNPKSPFTTYAGGSKTTVLGTSFNIKAREEDAEIEVEVFKGEVELSDADDSEKTKKHIKKHEKGSYNKSEKSTSKRKGSNKPPKWVRKVIKSKPVKTMSKEFKRLFNDVKKEL